MYEIFEKTVQRIIEKARKEGRLHENPSKEWLKMRIEEFGGKKTIYQNVAYFTEPTSRAARFTKNNVDCVFGQEEEKFLAQCEEVLSKEDLILIDRWVGEKEVVMRAVMPKKFAHLAFGGGNLFLPVEKYASVEPTYRILFFVDENFEKNEEKPLPEKDITIRLAFSEDGKMIKIVRNSTYTGELKKGVFAGQDWMIREKEGGIFLHAGCRSDYLQRPDGTYKRVNSLILALSANGKTTLTSKILARKSGEESWLIQDDGGALMPDGSFRGYEKGGIFVKTEGVAPPEQTEIYYGLLKPDSYLENVWVDENGRPDFFDYRITSNGRAVIERKDFLHAAPEIEVEKIDNIILITRGPIIPAIAKLTLEEAVAWMVGGQAMESSAGDPTQAGKIRQIFFYDPFVVGSRTKHTNRFYELLRELPNVKFFLLNTGGIGEGRKYRDISLSTTVSILDSLLRGGLDEEDNWIESAGGFKVPRAVRGVDPIFFHPEKLYSVSEFEEREKKLVKSIQEAIERVGEGMNSKILRVFK